MLETALPYFGPWRTLSREQARDYPLYGVGGWLVLLVAVEIIVQFAYLYLLSTPSWRASFAHSVGAAADMFLALALIMSVVYLLSVVLAITKNALFPILYIGVCVVNIIVIVISIWLTLVGTFHYSTFDMLIFILSDLIPRTVMILYIARSARVNLTYLHRIRESDGVRERQ